MKLLIKKLSETVQMPVYGDEYAAGLDLRSDEDCVIEAGKRKCIKTGLSIQWIKNNEDDEEPEKFYLRLAPRSGLGLKKSIDVACGVIDFSYRGEIGVVLINNGEEDFIINKGDKIVQAILTRIQVFSDIEFVDELSNTQRSNGSFGSTGVK